MIYKNKQILFESFGYERFNAVLGKEDDVQSNTMFGAAGRNYSSEKE